MLSIGAAALAFNAPLLPSASTAARSSATVMQLGRPDASQAIPFLKKPPGLDGPLRTLRHPALRLLLPASAHLSRASCYSLAGSMAGDIGFDPLQISDLVPLNWSREVSLPCLVPAQSLRMSAATLASIGR